ncbi:MAG TPA: YbaK/EbsC family protein [Draconibacterium sp.]|nr:YbaK/EbsC family protein [Draconibacterium sp.]
MPCKKLKAFLDANHIRYVSIRHSSAFTAQEIAAKTHISGKELAKTVMIKLDNKMAMAVLPASYQIDFDLLKELFVNHHVSLATEEEFRYLFPDCEVGAMPPFGNLYNMEVFVAQSLAEDETISFNAGSHTELLQMSYADYIFLVQPYVLKFSVKEVALPGDPSERWGMDY